MRILWISPNGGNYKNYSVNGSGSWIGALQSDLNRLYPDLEIGLTFESSNSAPLKEGTISYFPICTKRTGKIGSIIEMMFSNEKKREEKLIEGIARVINEYKPDVIHVWGVENSYASVIPHINVPFVVHIQGLLSLCVHAYLPPSFSESDLRRINPWWRPNTWVRKLLHISQIEIYKNVLYRAEREIRVSRYVKNWIGRTDWDLHASKMLSSNSKYYHCEEIMRGEFNKATWHYHYDNKVIKIQSSIGELWFKGIDVVLKTAKVLRNQAVEIEWNVYGVERDCKLVDYISKRLSINPEEVGVCFKGRVSGDVICKGLLVSDVYVHPSYIENSSNAIAEAMMLGVPTIAQYVGGNPSMLRDDSGILVPAGAPYDLAFAIRKAKDKAIMEGYSERALKVGRSRQDSDKTVHNLVSIYNKVAKLTD